MPFDYKKEYKEFYMPPQKPVIVEIPKMHYIAVRGTGNPNEEDGVSGVDYARKDTFHWISMIRLPDFVSRKDFDWATQEATKKKKLDFSKVEFLTYDEGLCVQCMHIGSYDDEPATIKAMAEFAMANGYEIDITPERFHHEIYLSDPRKANISKIKTVVRHPIK